MTDIPMPPGGAAATGGPPPDRGDETALLAALHTHLLDTMEGFDKAMEKADADVLGPLEAFHGLHRAHAEKIAGMLAALGGAPRDDGSLLGTVNRAVVEVRSWFDGGGHTLMEAMIAGEARMVAAFDAVIEASPSPERRGALQQMQTELRRLLQRHAPGAA